MKIYVVKEGVLIDEAFVSFEAIQAIAEIQNSQKRTPKEVKKLVNAVLCKG